MNTSYNIPKCLFFISLFLLFFSLYKAQNIAGEHSPGMTVNELNINLSVPLQGNNSEKSIDLNCDGKEDLRIRLHKGSAAICGANNVTLFVLNSSLEFCKDTSGIFTSYFGRPHYFKAGTELTCPSGSEWVSDTAYTLGDNGGCITCTGPAIESNSYIAYRLNGQVGWISISFDITASSSVTIPITLSIDSVLMPCTTSIQQHENAVNLDLYPNPLYTSSTLSFNKYLSNAAISVFNCLGTMVLHIPHANGQSVQLTKNDFPAGIYQVHLMEMGKITGTCKLFVSGE